MENIEILERLRGYDFFRINLKYEYEERLEKFLILASKINKFQLENGNLLNYEIIKKLLKKKNLRMVRDESAFRKLKLQEIVKENISTMKWRILDDLNAIFREDNIKFCFNKNFSDEQIEEQPKEFDKVKIENYLKILRFYTFNKVKTGLFEEYEDRLGRLLLLAKKSKAIKFIDENNEEQNLNYETVVSLMEKKDLSLQMSRIKFKQNSSFSSNSYLATSESYKKRIINDLNTIFKEENIIFELDESKNKEVIEETEVPKKKQTISERLEKYKIPLLSTGTFARYRENLEKFLMAVAKTHLFMKKKSKEPLTYPIIKELLSKKTLVMQTDKFEFSLKKLSTISPYIYDNLDKIQLMLLEDLNAIYDEEDIEFDFIEYVNKDEFIKSVKYQEKEEKDITSKVEDSIKVENEVEVKNKEVDMLIENSDGKSKLEKFVKILRKYHFRNIRQGLDKEYTDRLEKLFILVGKSKRVLVKNTKQIIDYEVAVSLMKKKGLKFQATKKEYNNGGFPENLARKFETYKNNIIEDLNTLYENEEIEFCLVDDIYSDNVSEKITEKDTEKVIENKVKKNSNEEKISKENQKLKEELENLKQTMEEMKEMFKTIQTDNINQFEKVEFDIPDFIRDMEYNEVITVRGNKEYFQKFKRFAILNDVPINLLVNYLFYYAMEELSKKK